MRLLSLERVGDDGQGNRLGGDIAGTSSSPSPGRLIGTGALAEGAGSAAYLATRRASGVAAVQGEQAWLAAVVTYGPARQQPVILFRSAAPGRLSL